MNIHNVPMLHINTIPTQVVREKGFARYPEDFPHLAPGDHFTAWRSGDDWEIETILTGQELMDRINGLVADCEKRPCVWEVKYRRRDGKVDFLWYGGLVDEAEARSRSQDMAAHGLEVLDMHPIDRLPTNQEYLAMQQKSNEGVTNERNQE